MGSLSKPGNKRSWQLSLVRIRHLLSENFNWSKDIKITYIFGECQVSCWWEVELQSRNISHLGTCSVLLIPTSYFLCSPAKLGWWGNKTPSTFWIWEESPAVCCWAKVCRGVSKHPPREKWGPLPQLESFKRGRLGTELYWVKIPRIRVAGLTRIHDWCSTSTFLGRTTLKMQAESLHETSIFFFQYLFLREHKRGRGREWGTEEPK